MILSPNTIAKILRRLEDVDDDIDHANSRIDSKDAMGAARWILKAESDKHRAVDICPGGFALVYDIFFYADVAERDAVLWRPADPDVTLDDVIESLEQSLADVEYLLDDIDLPDALDSALEDIATWLRDAIAGFKKVPPVAPANNGALMALKLAYLNLLDPSGELGELFKYLEGIDELLSWARDAVMEEPPNFGSATGYLRNAELLKHDLMRWLGSPRGPGSGLPPDWEKPRPDWDNPEPGSDDLPRIPPNFG